MTNNRYSFETKIEAVRLLNEGVSGRQICKRLGLKSDGLIYTWRNYVRNNDYFRLRQVPGKQYKYHKGSSELPKTIQNELDLKAIKEELEIVKNFLNKEGLW